MGEKPLHAPIRINNLALYIPTVVPHPRRPADRKLNLPAPPRLRIQAAIDFLQAAQRESVGRHPWQPGIQQRRKRHRIKWHAGKPDLGDVARSVELLAYLVSDVDVTSNADRLPDRFPIAGDPPLSHARNKEIHGLLDTG